MQFDSLFRNSGVRGMLETNYYRAEHMLIPIIGACVHHAKRFQSGANTTGVHRMSSSMGSKVMS